MHEVSIYPKHIYVNIKEKCVEKLMSSIVVR